MKHLILLCLLIPLQAISDTSVWRVSKGNSELFIGGTIHVLSQQDYPLPKEFQQAFNQSQILVLETDIDAMNQPAIQMQLTQRMMYSDGRTLRNDLKPETYQRLKDYLKRRNIPLTALIQFKPSMAMISLMMVELNRLGMTETGVDMFFNQKALAKNKPRLHLESVEKQLTVLENMAKGHEDELVLSTLRDLNSLPEMMNALKSAWRTGNLSQLDELGIKPMRDEQPSLYQLMLVERNNSWIPKLESLLSTVEKELVLVGSLHLAGQEGLLAQLQKRGYQVTSF